jgi:hypothetical protein
VVAVEVVAVVVGSVVVGLVVVGLDVLLAVEVEPVLAAVRLVVEATVLASPVLVAGEPPQPHRLAAKRMGRTGRTISVSPTSRWYGIAGRCSRAKIGGLGEVVALRWPRAARAPR